MTQRDSGIIGGVKERHNYTNHGGNNTVIVRPDLNN